MHSAFVDQLAQCYPFHQIDRDAVAALLARGELGRHRRGRALLRQADIDDTRSTYLLAGSIDLRRSFFDRAALQAGVNLALQPLEQLLAQQGGQIVAASDDCVTVTVARDLADRIMAAGGHRYTVDSLAERDMTDELRISDADIEVDWMARFLQSPLANQLTPATIQQLLACLHAAAVEAGATLVRRGDDGDAMYIVTRGTALVRTEPQGAFGGREITLIPGDYFGEESLVADTIRNATVVMEHAGSVARLGRDTFDELVRPQLVRTVVPPLPAGCDLIDVRFPAEFRYGALANSRNVPISTLRAQLHTFAGDRTVVVSGEGGRRAELGVFLLRQAGHDAWLLSVDGSGATGEIALARDAR